MKQKNFKYDSVLTIYLLIFLLVTFLGCILSTYSIISTHTYSMVLFVLGVFGLCIYILGKFYYRIKIDFFDIIIFILLLLEIISCFFAQNKEVAIVGFSGRNEGILSLFTYYILFLNCKNIKNKESILKIIYLILSTGIIQLSYAILQLVNFSQFRIIKNYWNSTGFLSNPNFFGSFMIIQFNLCLGMFIFSGKKNQKIVYFLFCLAFFFGILISGAMSAIVSLIFTIILLLIFALKFRFIFKPLLKKIFILLFSFLTIFSIYNFIDKNWIINEINNTSTEIISISSGKIKDNFGTGRIYIWRNTINALPENFITGSGPDNFLYSFKCPLRGMKTGRLIDKAHNEYLQRLITDGLFAFLIYMVFIFSIFFKCVKSFIQNKKSINFVTLSLFLSFVGYCVQAFFNISIIYVAPLFYIIMGFLVSQISNNNLEYKNE